jgi:hypothetical protein
MTNYLDLLDSSQEQKENLHQWDSHAGVLEIKRILDELNDVWVEGLEPAWEWDDKINEAFRKHDWNYFMNVLQLWKQHELKRIQEFQNMREVKTV